MKTLLHAGLNGRVPVPPEKRFPIRFNYYHRDPADHDSSPPERYPSNHVRFAPILKPIQWLEGLYKLFDSHAFKSESVLLKKFDAAAPLDACLGTPEELKHLRDLLCLYCEGIDHNPNVSPIGRFIMRKTALNMLANRQEVLRHFQANQSFIEQRGRFKTPVIITGLPRSGTTLLQRLISEDPNTRSPYGFEMEAPVPPRTPGTNPLEDPRIRESNASMNLLSRMAPGFMEKLSESHVLRATEMEESFLYMLAHNGIFIMAGVTAGRTYMEAFLEAEGKRPIFRYERLFFTMLDAYCPARSHWTLKAPIYAPYFPTIFEEYPDARVVITHRNPLVVLPSVCRLMESWSIAFDRDGAFDKYRFGALLQATMKNYMTVPLNYRKEHPEKKNQIFDCMYAELFADPIAMVKRIYDQLGLAYTREFEDRMKVYLDENKQGKYGRHKYSLAEYGLTAEAVYRDYEEYMKAYDFNITDTIIRPAALDSGVALG